EGEPEPTWVQVPPQSSRLPALPRRVSKTRPDLQAPSRNPAPGLSSPVPRLLFLLALLTLPLVGHGCHGDDVDHEPAAAPPARTGALPDPDPKTSR
ncbi:hypothetical protein J0H58_00145, partial [bacterium]|nr:hypothetical protein [bacterium]